MRKAASLAIDRNGSNQALTLGHSLVTGNAIVPKGYDFYWQPPEPVYDPAAAKKLLAEAGYPNGFDGGDYNCDASYSNIGESVVDNLLRRRHPHQACGRSSAPPSSKATARKNTRT